MLDSETVDEWTIPEQESLRQNTLAVDSDLAQGVDKISVVERLVGHDGWPKEAAVSFVDQVEREGRGRRRLRKTPRYPRGRAAPMADAPLEDHIDWYEDEGFQVVSLTDTLILVREVFQAKYGKGDELVAIFKEARQQWLQGLATRVLADLSGSFFTVVVEIEMESLADWERRIAELFAQPGSADWFSRMMPLVESGRREFYTIKA